MMFITLGRDTSITKGKMETVYYSAACRGFDGAARTEIYFFPLWVRLIRYSLRGVSSVNFSVKMHLIKKMSKYRSTIILIVCIYMITYVVIWGY